MKRWLTVGAASLGVFALGLFAGVILSRKAYTRMYGTMCVALFEDKSSSGFGKMVAMATGHVDEVYNLLEGEATLCLSLNGMELVKCKTRLKNFYDRYPDRRAGLERNHPNAARALGYGPNQ